MWYLNPLDSGDNPTANQLLIDYSKQSISQLSYLDKPSINSIASVYQSKIIKDAMQFHHAAFLNCAKSTLLAAAAKKSPTVATFNRDEHIQVCHRDISHAHGSHAVNKAKPSIYKKGDTAILSEP